jgi:hypothetical protein
MGPRPHLKRGFKCKPFWHYWKFSAKTLIFFWCFDSFNETLWWEAGK